ncbi:MAG: hypothetical protein AAF252_09465 [Pseudomonadota bacterium]
MLAFVPALCLGGYWFGGEAMLVGVALLLPMIWMMLGGLETFVKKRMARLPVSGLIEPEAYRKRVDAVREDVATTERHSAVFVLEIDDFPTLTSRFEPGAVDRVLKAIGLLVFCENKKRKKISRTSHSLGICDSILHSSTTVNFPLMRYDLAPCEGRWIVSSPRDGGGDSRAL